MRRALFVAGTDTGVGKTLVATALLAAAGARGLRTVGLKPLAAGAVRGPDGLRNEDAELLLQTMNCALPYQAVNPVVVEPPIAPHLALADAGIALDAQKLHEQCTPALAQACDLLVVEGAGGWRVPLGGNDTLADFARLLGFPVLLVVGMRLGCLNHALLSAEAIRGDGLRLAGWVVNVIDPGMARLDDNIATLRERLDAPCIGTLPWRAGITSAAAASSLALDGLLRSLAS